MSLTKWVTVHCDAEGCMAWDDVEGGGYTGKDARQIAKRHGWTHRDGKDYCPEHSR